MPAGSGRVTELAGALAISGAMAAHAVLAARGEWVTNEKRLLERAGLRDMDEFVIGLQPAPSVLEGMIDQATQRLSDPLAKEAPKSARKGGPEG